MMIEGNTLALRHLNTYEERALSINLHQDRPDERPSGRVAIECSDGRVAGGISAVTHDPDGLARFTVQYLPSAGCMTTADLEAIARSRNPALELQRLLNDHTARERLFTQLDEIFIQPLLEQQLTSRASTLAGKKLLLGEDFPHGTPRSVIRNAEWLIGVSGERLLEGNRSPVFSTEAMANKMRDIPHTGYPVTLTFRSHSDKHNDAHGCGAFGSELDKALQMTAVNALAAQAYVDHRFNGHPLKPHIVREHHFTGEDEQIVDAQNPELLSQIDPRLREAIADPLAFHPLYYKDRESHLVRLGKRNPFGINKKEHHERVVRISQDHRAFVTESALRQIMLPDQKLEQRIVNTLIAIARKNRLSRDTHQPLFLHLDRPAGDIVRERQFDALERTLLAMPEIQAMHQQGMLFIIRSQTVPLDFEKPDRLQMRFE